ncbi:site-specific integrase [uncultured Paraglaciecola sp.]|uniref:site-specific integrase n=1 Tax=uncultured Paraglaciecola sp. TaxID=1765024 RepID=UPI002607A057|nr:site-specific integrase [uncultured Paraglaciecola sp.]
MVSGKSIKKTVKKRKHVKKITIKKNGVVSWELLDGNGQSIQGYSIFMDDLIKQNEAFNTRRSYALHISQFYDYLYEVACLYGGLTEETLEDACEAYETYMIKGDRVTDYSIVNDVTKGLPSPKITAKSYDPHHAALQRFLRLSAKSAKHIAQRMKAGFDTNNVPQSELPMFDVGRRELANKERAELISNSILASTMSGGANTIAANILKRRYPSSSNSSASNIFDDEAEQRTFPWDRFQELLDAAPNHRARTLWALIAAIGCRFSEAIAILNADIDIAKRKVKLIAAKTRPEAYPYLSVEQLDQLAFKTRETRETFMISWGQKFFEYLLEYRRSGDYRIAVKNDFVFQSQGATTFGEPQVFNSYTSALNTFQNAVRKVLGEDATKYGFHSLRHMYGFYLKNYAPRADGKYGLDPSDVQAYMGHANPSSTKRYALDVKERLELQLIYANEVSTGREGPETLLKLKLERNQKEYEQLMAEAKACHLVVDKRFNGIAEDD